MEKNQYPIMKYNGYNGDFRNMRSALIYLGLNEAETLKIRDKYSKFDLELLIRDLWIKRVKEVHPDRHLYRKEYYTGLLSVTNKAYNRLKFLNSKRHEGDLLNNIKRDFER